MLYESIRAFRGQLGESRREVADIFIDELLKRYTGTAESSRSYYGLRRRKPYCQDELVWEATREFQQRVDSHQTIRLQWSFYSFQYYSQFPTVTATLDWFEADPADWDALMGWWGNWGQPTPWNYSLFPDRNCIECKPPRLDELVYRYIDDILFYARAAIRRPCYRYLVELYEMADDLESEILSAMLPIIFQVHWKPRWEVRKILRTAVAHKICDIAKHHSRKKRSRHCWDAETREFTLTTGTLNVLPDDNNSSAWIDNKAALEKDRNEFLQDAEAVFGIASPEYKLVYDLVHMTFSDRDSFQQDGECAAEVVPKMACEYGADLNRVRGALTESNLIDPD